MNRPQLWLRYVFAVLVFLAALSLGIWALAHGGHLASWNVSMSEHSLTATIRGWGAWGVGGSIGLMVLHSFVPFPAEALTLANGMVFGSVKGTVVTWVGAMLGAVAAFGLARLFGQPLVRRVLSEHQWRALERFSREQGWQTLLIMRLIPMIAFNLINYAAGLSSVSFWTFLWTTAVGILPLTILLNFMGEEMLELPWWGWLALLLVAGVAWWLLRSFRRAREVGEETG